MNEKSFGKAVIGTMCMCLFASLLVPVIRNGKAFWPFLISLCLGILAVFGYLQFRKRRKRVTPMSVVGWLWVLFCLPLLIFLGAVLADQWARHSDVYRFALAAARSSEKAKSELGPSPKIGWPIEEQMEFSNDSGSAFLRIPVSGIHGEDALRARGTKTKEVWQLDALDLKLANGEVWDIVKAPNHESKTNSPSLEQKERVSNAAQASANSVQKRSGSGLGLLSPWYMIFICCLAGPIFFIAAIPYTLTLQNALMKCAPQSRAMHQSLLWMLFIPFVGLISNFFVVSDMSDSFRAEFRRRGIPSNDHQTRKIGMTMCICWVCAFFPLMGIPAIIASPVLWIIYWRKIAKLSRMLDAVPMSPA